MINRNQIIHANTGETVDCHTVRLYVLLQIKGTSSLSKHKTNTIYSLTPPTSAHLLPQAEINRSKIFMFVQKSIDVNQTQSTCSLLWPEHKSDTPVDRWPRHRSARRRAHYLRGTKQTEAVRPSPAAVRLQSWQVISAALRYVQLYNIQRSGSSSGFIRWLRQNKKHSSLRDAADPSATRGVEIKRLWQVTCGRTGSDQDFMSSLCLAAGLYRCRDFN